jgi:hypothetical protein
MMMIGVSRRTGFWAVSKQFNNLNRPKMDDFVGHYRSVVDAVVTI